MADKFKWNAASLQHRGRSAIQYDDDDIKPELDSDSNGRIIAGYFLPESHTPT
jgi:hypothetical protein